MRKLKATTNHSHWQISTLHCFLLLSFYFIAISVFAQFNPQTKSITKKFFPEVEFDIATPAFSKSSGFTNYAEMMDWLNNTIKPHADLATLSFIGESQKGKSIPLVILSKKNGLPKTRVWMQGGLHGDEPAGTEAMLHLISQLLNDPKFKDFLENLEIAIIPMANIDGYEKQERTAANGADLNRDQTRLKEKESICLKSAFSAFQPAVALDFHEYRPFRKDYVKMGRAGITSRYDAMFLYSGNLNVPKVLRDFTQNTFVKNAKLVLEQNQLATRDYITTKKKAGKVVFNMGSEHSRSSASNFALTNCVSTLLEIRGVGLGRTSFKRRIKATYLIAVSYLETTVKENKDLLKVLEEAEKSQHPVVVTSEREVIKDSIIVIDLATENEWKMPATIHNALNSKAIISRERPKAYLLDKKEKKAAFRLKILGLHVDSLATEREIEVESLQAMKSGKEDSVETHSQDPEEDAESNHESASIATIKKKFPAGTYVVYLNQRRSNLACEIMEPENANGFVKMKVIKWNDNQELPIYRFMKPEKLTP